MKKSNFNFNSLTIILSQTLVKLPTPSSISYLWNFGSLLGFCLILQILTGILLSMHFTGNIMLAFDSVIHITRDVNMGWLMRFSHMNGASLFFIIIFLHISRGMLFSSFKLKSVWFSGILILFILMGTAFLGYVLPWGQMSFWGATVITNLVSAVPYFGQLIVEWLWGGFSVDNPTLSRFFSLHFLMPFILTALIVVHITFLHVKGSSNPTGMKSNMDKIIFHPFFSSKDILGVFFVFFVFLLISLIFPFCLGDPENFNPANPLNTPIHIQPEWYFLFAYAILRSIPNKLGGVIALVLSILIISILSFKKKKNSSHKFSMFSKFMFFIYSNLFILLTWIGANPVESPFETTGKIIGILYFISVFFIYLYFFVLKTKSKFLSD